MNAPHEVAANYIEIGKKKTQIPISKMLVLAIMAGMFIALGAVGANTASATITNASLAKLIGAMVFPTGLTMVLIAGSELFTGNTLMVIPLLSKEITVGAMLKNWLFVFIGNLIGAIVIVLICAVGNQWGMFDGALAVTTIKVAVAKSSLDFSSAIALGIGCNLLVCVAIWISFAAKTVVGKVVGLYLPIMLFVLSGFEHNVANMYYVPAGIIAAMNQNFAALAVQAGINIDALGWGTFFYHNLLPVTIGNIIGGSILVGCVYWYSYLKK